MQNEAVTYLVILAFILSIIAVGVAYFKQSPETDLSGLEDRIDSNTLQIVELITKTNDLSVLNRGFNSLYTKVIRLEQDSVTENDLDDFEDDLSRFDNRLDNIEDCLEDSENFTEFRECWE